MDEHGHAAMMAAPPGNGGWRFANMAVPHHLDAGRECQPPLLTVDAAAGPAALSRTGAAVAQLVGKVARAYGMAAGYAQERRISALENELKLLRSKLDEIGHFSVREAAWLSAVARHYVPLVAQVEGIVAVSVFVQLEACDIITIVRHLSPSGEDSLYAAEFQVLDVLPEGQFDFTVLDALDGPLPPLPAGAVQVFEA